MTAPDAGRAPALDQDRPRLRILAGSQPLTAGAATDTGTDFVIGADDFVRAQLPLRFVEVDLEVFDGLGHRSTDWWRLLIHSCAAHLLPLATLHVHTNGAGDASPGSVEAIANLAAATGLDPLDPTAVFAGPTESERTDGTVTVARWRRTGRRTVHDLVAEARASLDRITPADLAAQLGGPGVVVLDTRTPTDRDLDGVIAGSIHAPRTVLEWIVDPASGYAEDLGAPTLLVVVCNEGYSSSLAARTLQDLGHQGATDLIGGMQAWVAAGLATSRPDGHHRRCLLPEERHG